MDSHKELSHDCGHEDETDGRCHVILFRCLHDPEYIAETSRESLRAMLRTANRHILDTEFVLGQNTPEDGQHK